MATNLQSHAESIERITQDEDWEGGCGSFQHVADHLRQRTCQHNGLGRTDMDGQL